MLGFELAPLPDFPFSSFSLLSAPPWHCSSATSASPGDAMRRSVLRSPCEVMLSSSMYGVWVQHTSLLCRRFLLLRINSPMVVASGSYSVTDPIRCRSTASGSTAGRSTAVGQRHFPFGAQSGIAKFNSYFIPPTLAFLLSLLLRLGQWSRVSLQQHAVAGIGRETRSPAFPSASRSSAKFNIGAANMRLGYY